MSSVRIHHGIYDHFTAGICLDHYWPINLVHVAPSHFKLRPACRMTGGFDNFYVIPIGWDWYIYIYKFNTNINWMVLSEQEYDQFAHKLRANEQLVGGGALAPQPCR